MRNATRIVVLAAVIVSAIGCQGRERSITGSLGSAVISGQVSMTGTFEGASPAGIAVSIPGTGMTTTLSDDGRFIFVGTFERATLTFRRAADGIDETHEVQANGNLIVPLSRHSTSRRRSSGVRVTQIEGLVQQVSATSITVSAHNADIELEINDRTIIRHGNRTLTPADLHIGDRVHVRAEMRTAATGVALEIKLQNPEGDRENEEPGMAAANGTVASLGDHQLVVSTHSGPQITVRVTAHTQIKRQGRAINFGDIRVGDRIQSHGTPVDSSTITAIHINIEPGSNNGHGRH